MMTESTGAPEGAENWKTPDGKEAEGAQEQETAAITPEDDIMDMPINNIPETTQAAGQEAAEGPTSGGGVTGGRQGEVDSRKGGIGHSGEAPRVGEGLTTDAKTAFTEGAEGLKKETGLNLENIIGGSGQ